MGVLVVAPCAAVLGLSLRWPLHPAWRLAVVPLIDGSWGAPWEALARPPGDFQRQALTSLVGAVVRLALAAEVTAALSLLLHAVSRILRHGHSLIIRRSLGASLRSLGRLVGADLLLLGALGCALGLAAGEGAVHLLLRSWPAALAGPAHVRLSPTAVGAAAAGVGLLLCAVAAGLPALIWRGVHSVSQLQGDHVTARGPLLAAQSAFAALQLAALLVVSYGCALVVAHATVFEQRGAPPPRSLVVVPLRLTAPEGASLRARAGAYAELIESLRRKDPSAAITSRGALLGLGKGLGVVAFCGDCFVGGNLIALTSTSVRVIAVAPGALARLAATVTRGRDFGPQDTLGAPRVAVLSDIAAYRLFPGSRPLGNLVRTGMRPEDAYTVVGVARGLAPRGLGSPGGRLPLLYVSLLQHPPVLAEAVGESATRLTTALAQTDSNRAGPRFVPGAAEPLARLLHDFRAPLGWFGAILIALGALTAGLAAFALAAQLVQLVTVREHEIATRMALGASARHIAGWVARRALAITTLGAAIGIPVAAQVGYAMRGAGASPEDAFVTLLGLAAGLGALGVLVSLVAAFRAIRIPPAAVWSKAGS